MYNSVMPSSRITHIPTIIHWVELLSPQSILDVGTGFGKWGHLFREYTDIIQAEHDIPRYQRKIPPERSSFYAKYRAKNYAK